MKGRSNLAGLIGHSVIEQATFDCAGSVALESAHRSP
jgi:hypothetical protein